MEELTDSQKSFIGNYGRKGYLREYAIIARCNDCAEGTASIKGIGLDRSGIKEVEKYLIPDSRMKKEPEEYLRYVQMAYFYEFTRKALLVNMGLAGVGEPTFATDLPDFLAGMMYSVTSDKSNMKTFQRRINADQLLNGGCVCFLEPSSMENIASGSPSYFINRYSRKKYINAKFEERSGIAFPRFVLMDESDWEFDMTEKIFSYVNKYRVYGLDANGEYYQAPILYHQWKTFDVMKPIPAVDETNPQFGEAVYPVAFGRRYHEIPCVFCNVSHLSGTSSQNPFLSNIADLDVTIFNADAAYRRTLWLTSNPLFTVIGGEGKDLSLKLGDSIHYLSEGFQEHFTEFTGAGAAAQRTAIMDLETEAKNAILSLVTTGNQSGEALKMIQGSQVAPLVSLIQTSGEAISKLIQHGAGWSGRVNEKEIKSIQYKPSMAFAKMNISVSDILAIASMKKSDPQFPMLRKEIRHRLEETGAADEVMKNFDEFMDEIEEENTQYGSSAAGPEESPEPIP